MAGRIGSVYFLDKPLDSELPNRDGFFLPPGLYFTGQGCHFRFFYADAVLGLDHFFFMAKITPSLGEDRGTL